MGTKLDELIIYISKQSKDDPNYGSTKLNKILFVADFYYYGYYGKSISGVDYMHIDRGPAPIPMKPALTGLISKKRITIEEIDNHGYKMKRVNPIDEPDMSLFTDDEIKFIDQQIDKFKNHNGTELSEWTHRLLPWMLTSDKEKIPYESIFSLCDLPVGKAGIDWALGELKRIREHCAYDN